MGKTKKWTDKEIELLRELYPSNKTFSEIMENFPQRTGNAIRLKASRLKIKRPYIDDVTQLKPIKFRSNSRIDSIGYLIRCDVCGSWMQLSEKPQSSPNYHNCAKCGTPARVQYISI